MDPSGVSSTAQPSLASRRATCRQPANPLAPRKLLAATRRRTPSRLFGVPDAHPVDVGGELLSEVEPEDRQNFQESLGGEENPRAASGRVEIFLPRPAGDFEDRGDGLRVLRSSRIAASNLPA